MYSRPMSLVVMVRVLVVRDTPSLLAQYSRTCHSTGGQYSTVQQWGGHLVLRARHQVRQHVLKLQLPLQPLNNLVESSYFCHRNGKPRGCCNNNPFVTSCAVVR